MSVQQCLQSSLCHMLGFSMVVMPSAELGLIFSGQQKSEQKGRSHDASKSKACQHSSQSSSPPSTGPTVAVGDCMMRLMWAAIRLLLAMSDFQASKSAPYVVRQVIS